MTDPGDIVTDDSSGDWLIDATAIESIIALGQRLVPEHCPRNNYILEFAFSPVPDGRQDVVRGAMSALEDSNASMRVLAANALGAMGPVAGRAVAALRRHLHDEEPKVREAAKEALERIAP